MPVFREELVKTLIEVGRAQIENGELESLESTPAARELERRKLIEIKPTFFEETYEQVRLSKKGKEMLINEGLKMKEEMAALASALGIQYSELTEDRIREFLLMDCD